MQSDKKSVRIIYAVPLFNLVELNVLWDKIKCRIRICRHPVHGKSSVLMEAVYIYIYIYIRLIPLYK